MNTIKHTASIADLIDEYHQLWSDGERAENAWLHLKKVDNETDEQRLDRISTENTLKAFEDEAKERASDIEDFLSRRAPETPEEALILATLATVVANRIRVEGEESRRLIRLIAELRAYLVRHCGKSTADLGLDILCGPWSDTWQSKVETTRQLLAALESKTPAHPKAA